MSSSFLPYYLIYQFPIQALPLSLSLSLIPSHTLFLSSSSAFCLVRIFKDLFFPLFNFLLLIALVYSLQSKPPLILFVFFLCLIWTQKGFSQKQSKRLVIIHGQKLLQAGTSPRFVSLLSSHAHSWHVFVVDLEWP